MKLLKKIIGVFIGIIILGIGVALSKAAALGQDPLAAFIFSFVYLFDEKLPYSTWYIIINLLFFIVMLIFLRKKINIGTIAGLIFIGIFSDIFYGIFVNLNIIPTKIILRLIVTILGIVFSCFGIAFYGSANLGLAPYDALSVLISGTFPKIKFKFARIIMDTTCTVIAIIIGCIVLHRSDLVNINTILNFIFAGPLIGFFSKFIAKIYYKEEHSDFN